MGQNSITQNVTKLQNLNGTEKKLKKTQNMTKLKCDKPQKLKNLHKPKTQI